MTTTIPLQAASQDIWEQKYQEKDVHGNPLEKTPKESFARVAKALADVEPKNKKKWEKEFIKAMEMGAVPAGRIMSNAGTFKKGTSLINCTVSGELKDSMESILEGVKEAGMTLRAGCGIGYEFSGLRPKGAFVAGSGSYTSGPLSFMKIFDTMCFTISSAGGRRGAQMGTFDVRHPDVIDFIQAKREAGQLSQFNLSLLITDNFINAVKNEEQWPLHFPILKSEQDITPMDLDNKEDVIWADWSLNPPSKYLINDKGQYACKIYKTIGARNLWDMIMSSTYDFAEPGFILIDHSNRMNNNWFCEDIRATNPCGEQLLPPHGACLLGSVNLVNFVMNPFTKEAFFDLKAFKSVVKVFSRMLDNVVEINGLPLAQQREEIERKRRHGMGYLGLGSALNILGVAYGSAEAVKLTEDISQAMAIGGWEAALDLAKEKGPAPIMNEDFEITAKMMNQRPQMAADGIKIGDKIKGKVLFARYSAYMQQIAGVDQELVAELEEYGARYTHHTSIAPTGTIALSVGNNTSNGIEPSFSMAYKRNIIKAGKKTKVQVDVYSYEMLAYRAYVGAKEGEEVEMPESFVVADDVTPEQHVDMQAASQYWIDASISKTVNVPTNIEFDKFKNLYMYASEQGLKGCTTFRFNPDVFTGVLVREDDLDNTEYKFTLESGEQVTLKGSDKIEYEGETHVAANLYDALSGGYYGKL